MGLIFAAILGIVSDGDAGDRESGYIRSSRRRPMEMFQHDVITVPANEKGYSIARQYYAIFSIF